MDVVLPKKRSNGAAMLWARGEDVLRAYLAAIKNA
jgi:hypothetical protein